MTKWTSHNIESNGLTLHYTRTGGDKPPFILCHGFSDDGLCWTPVAEVLAESYDVIMLDARGHGRSDGPEDGYGSLEHAADAAGLIQELALEKPLVMGHSMGAATALALAGTYPDLPRAILLEDPPSRWFASAPTITEGNRRQRFGGWVVELKRKTADEMIAQCRELSPNWPEDELAPWAESKLRLSFNVLTSERSEEVDWSSVIGQITCPTLLITADPELGAIVSEEASTELKTLLPQVQVAHIPGAGHNIRREKRARFLDVIQTYLSEIGA